MKGYGDFRISNLKIKVIEAPLDRVLRTASMGRLVRLRRILFADYVLSRFKNLTLEYDVLLTCRVMPQLPST
ncbi:MAG: hypothetical protein P3X22_002775 [Thermoprotei archaeon]|nr:hypothetical protein [Thermoprotei archaeon]